MKPIRLGIVGAGHLGRIHARIASSLAEFTLVGVADPVSDAAARLAAEHGCSFHTDHHALLDQIDAVVVATPTVTHHAVAKDFLACGVNVLVEKPLAPTLAEADDLASAARDAHRVLQVGHVERFNPAWSTAQPHLREPKYIEAVRASGYTFRSTDIGVVLDLMIHDLDLILSIARSRCARVEALGISVFGGHEDIANARLTFENGCVATLSASRASHVATRRMQVWSQRAYAALDFTARTVSLVRPSAALADREIDFTRLSTEEKAAMKDRLLSDHLPLETLSAEPSDAITAELKDFADSVRTGRRPRVDGEQARDTIAIAEAILSKIAAHAWNGAADGPIGPHFAPPAKVLRGPHWDRAGERAPVRHREAG